MSLALSPMNTSLEDENIDEPLKKKEGEFDMKDINNMLKQLNITDDTPKGQEEDEECVICYNNPPDAVVMPCGHGGICYECSLNI